VVVIIRASLLLSQACPVWWNSATKVLKIEDPQNLQPEWKKARSINPLWWKLFHQLHQRAAGKGIRQHLP
jgi:hypothetical protein